MDNINKSIGQFRVTDSNQYYWSFTSTRDTESLALYFTASGIKPKVLQVSTTIPQTCALADQTCVTLRSVNLPSLERLGCVRTRLSGDSQSPVEGDGRQVFGQKGGLEMGVSKYEGDGRQQL